MHLEAATSRVNDPRSRETRLGACKGDWGFAWRGFRVCPSSTSILRHLYMTHDNVPTVRASSERAWAFHLLPVRLPRLTLTKQWCDGQPAESVRLGQFTQGDLQDLQGTVRDWALRRRRARTDEAGFGQRPYLAR